MSNESRTVEPRMNVSIGSIDSKLSLRLIFAYSGGSSSPASNPQADETGMKDSDDIIGSCGGELEDAGGVGVKYWRLKCGAVAERGEEWIVEVNI